MNYKKKYKLERKWAIVFFICMIVFGLLWAFESSKNNKLEKEIEDMNEEFEYVAEDMLQIIKYCAESNNITMFEVIEESFGIQDISENGGKRNE